jgi:hypothetical protein
MLLRVLYNTCFLHNKVLRNIEFMKQSLTECRDREPKIHSDSALTKLISA